MPKIIIIRGNAGSGKSSLAKQVQHALGEGTLLLSQDQIRREMLLAHDGFETPTIPLLITLLQYAHTHCKTVILEGILRSDWYKPLFNDIVERYGKEIYAYYYDLPFEETLRRHQTRHKSQEFGEESLRRWWQPSDYLTQFSETTLPADLSLDQAKCLILKDIKAGNSSP